MAIETLILILSTALSITFMQCCKIVLMFYNGMGIRNGCLPTQRIWQLFFIPC